ncbi:MAG: formylglycine-generating enzyme family protein, partial [Phycisphaerae bacterium]|nr:formylglycine-generating enzyme family protein [Phycisphaerae bacterium]
YMYGMTDSAVASATYTATGITLALPGEVTIELVLIPAGSFEMGTNWTDDEFLRFSRPVHTVTFAKAFYMGKTEVTQAQYEAVMGANPSEMTGPNRPVERVDWYNAMAFCAALSAHTGRTVRLPSESEWEYACKAGSGDTKWYFGNEEARLTDYAWYPGNNSPNGTKDVGGKLPNAWGLYDMSGNVQEFCLDWWSDSYDPDGDGLVDTPTDGSAWTTGDSTYRVARGGSWGFWDTDVILSRSAMRGGLPPSGMNNFTGFRVVVSPD